MDVASVITNYAEAQIPLETMWTDIGERAKPLPLIKALIILKDYMDRRRIFTVDPDYFPLPRMREIVAYLHAHNQKYGTLPVIIRRSDTHGRPVLMTDPAVAYLPGQGYAPYDNGKKLDVWLKAPNGSESLGVVWPGEY